MFELFIEESLTNNMLREFCQNHELPHSGDKRYLIDTITSAYNENTVTEDNINELVLNAAIYGKNRHTLFLSIANIENLTNARLLGGLQRLTNSTNYLNFNHLNNEDTNTPNNGERNLDNFSDDIELEYCNYDNTNFIRLIYTYRYSNTIEDAEGHQTQTYSKDFYYIEINRENATIYITMPSQIDYFGRCYSTKRILNVLTDKLANYFDIYLNEINTESRQLLHEIFQSIIEVAETPIVDLLNNISQDSITGIMTVVEDLDIYTHERTLNSISNRFIDLLTRFIIEENFEIYSNIPEGTPVTLKEMRYTDETEATVKASTGTGLPEDRMDICDIFFDTKHTIQESGLVDELVLQWHFEEINDTVSNNQIKTKLLAGSNYLLIHYDRIKLTQEVVNFVLSHLRTYERFYY